MNVAREVRAFETELRAIGTRERAEKEKAYLKSTREHYGCKVPEIRRQVKRWLKAHPELDREDLWALLDELWPKGVHELCRVACELLQHRAGLLGVMDLPRIEELLRECRTWALLDELAIHVVGGLWLEDPETVELTLSRWVQDEDFWIQRSALLARLPGLRREGCRGWREFTRDADSLLEEKEFFLRKAIGWVLRETSKVDAARVVKWAEPRLSRMSGVTFRELVRRLPEAEARRLKALRA